MKMKIAYFSNQISMSFGYGVKRYSSDLLYHLRQNRNIEITPISTWSDLPKNELAQLKKEIGLEVLGLGRYLNMLSWTYFNSPRLERITDCDFDIVHTTFLGHPVPTSKKSIATVHDIGPLLHSDWFSIFKNIQMKRAIGFGLKQYDHFICVSKYTESTFLKWVDENFPGVSVRTKVIYEGVHSDFKTIPNKKEVDQFVNSLSGKIQNFILLVGKSSFRKNYRDVILALDKVRNDVDFHLVVIGSDGNEDGLLELVHNLKIYDRVHFLGFVDNSTLKLYYYTCTALLYPSRFEGFGLPLIEAMSLGCIVIWPENSSISEIAMNQGIKLGDLTVEGIAESIRTLNDLNPHQKEILKMRAAEYSKKFDWKDTADRVYSSYEELFNK
jgi:glycosyltransferase involved in cell wall biosynthesis